MIMKRRKNTQHRNKTHAQLLLSACVKSNANGSQEEVITDEPRPWRSNECSTPEGAVMIRRGAFYKLHSVFLLAQNASAVK